MEVKEPTLHYNPNSSIWTLRMEEERRENPSQKNKWNFPFCCVFTNQAGTVIYSFQGITLMLTTLLIHWYSPSMTSAGTRAVQDLLLHTYLIIMIAGFVIAFVSAYFEKGGLAKAAAILVGVGTLLYVIFFILSFFTRSMVMLYVCPEMRCADHHWLQDSTWRGYVIYSEHIERYRKDKEQIINSTLRNETVCGKKPKKIKRYVVYQNLNSGTNTSNCLTDNNTQTKTNEQPPKPFPMFPGVTPGYIRFASIPDDERYICIVLSILFGMIMIAYFVYGVVTFYSFGMYLSSDE